MLTLVARDPDVLDASDPRTRRGGRTHCGVNGNSTVRMQVGRGGDQAGAHVKRKRWAQCSLGTRRR